MSNKYREWKVEELFREYPYIAEYWASMSLPLSHQDQTLGDLLQSLTTEILDDMGIDRESLIENFDLFIGHMVKVKNGTPLKINSITIVGGQDKSGSAEKVFLTMNPGEIICVVGPTGSGKSRLLADIEWMAQGDTPTRRRIMVNGIEPPREWRYSLEHKLVAQLSQNMNFVVDMTAHDFIAMHAESRMVDNPGGITAQIIEQANHLAGERFGEHTPVTSLSGGQSRALMIADTALLSTSPIVLIDEIENAGIDKKSALNLLVKEDKIVLIATHDPIMSLMGNKRIIIKNGGIKEILYTSILEKANLKKLEDVDGKIRDLRNMIRSGKRIEFDMNEYFL